MRTHEAVVLSITAVALGACESGGPGGPSADAGTGADGGLTPDSAPRPRPIELGAGYNAGLAVDPMGTAYVAWVGPESTTTSLNFCRLPRGAQACEVRNTIATEGTSLSRPFLAVSGTTVQVLSFRYGLTGGEFSAVFLFTSTDGGRTFGAGRKVGTAPFSEATLGPDGRVSLVTHAYHNGMAYQAVPLGAGAAATAEAILSTTHPYSGAVGLLEGGIPVVVYANGSGDAQVRRYMGAGDLNAAASWTPPQDIGKGDRMHLAGGSKGLFLMAQVDSGLQVRRYGGGIFGPGVSLPNGTGELAQAHLIQDATGRLHALWPRIDANGFHLYYAISDEGGVWQHGIVTADEGFAGVRAAVAPDRIGLAVWATGPSSGTAKIHAVPLGPAPQ